MMKQDIPRLVGNMLNLADIFATQNWDAKTGCTVKQNHSFGLMCCVFVTKTKPKEANLGPAVLFVLSPGFVCYDDDSVSTALMHRTPVHGVNFEDLHRVFIEFHTYMMRNALKIA